MGLELSKLGETAQPVEKRELAPDLWSGNERSLTQARSASNLALAEFVITDSGKDQQNDKSKSEPELKTPAEKVGDKSDEMPKPESREAREAGPLLFQVAEEAVNQSIYQLPRWAKLAKPSPDLGCVSSFSNRYREAMKLAGLISGDTDTQFRNFYQVNMDELNKSLGLFSADPEKQLMKPISPAEVKEGDIIQGLTPGTSSRHLGIVGKLEDGKRKVYDNYGGTWRKESLDERFGRYPQHNYYRVYFPPKS